MLIATWEKSPAWSSTHPIGFMRDGAKKEPVDEIRHEDADPPRFLLD